MGAGAGPKSILHFSLGLQFTPLHSITFAQYFWTFLGTLEGVICRNKKLSNVRLDFDY